MKLVRYGPAGHEKPGLIDDDWQLRDLSEIVSDLDGSHLSPERLDLIEQTPAKDLPLVEGKQRLGCPVANVGKFIAIGLNYFDHAVEANMPIPAEPVVFMKANSSITGPNDHVMLPKNSTKTDWEVELGIVIGKRARYVKEQEAIAHVAGYCVINDISEREFQLERGPQWDICKGCDTFGPIGPWLVTTSEIGDPHNLNIWLDVNGVRMQSGNTRTMIFRVEKLVSYVSEFMTLYPGDVITTGTPPGVGLGMNPPRYLEVGDCITLGIQGLGEQSQIVVRFAP